MAVVLVCSNGNCGYTVCYKDESAAELLRASKRVGGFDCPSCRAKTIKLKRTVKNPVSD